MPAARSTTGRSPSTSTYAKPFVRSPSPASSAAASNASVSASVSPPCERTATSVARGHDDQSRLRARPADGRAVGGGTGDGDAVLGRRRHRRARVVGEAADQAVDRRSTSRPRPAAERQRDLGQLLARPDEEHALAGQRLQHAVERDARDLLERTRDAVDVDLALDAVEDTLGAAEGHGDDAVGRDALEELRLVVRVAASRRAGAEHDQQAVVIGGERRRQPVETDLERLGRRRRPRAPSREPS